MANFFGKLQTYSSSLASAVGPQLDMDLKEDPGTIDYEAVEGGRHEVTINVALSTPATTTTSTEKVKDQVSVDAKEAAMEIAPIAARMGVTAVSASIGIPPDALALAEAGMGVAGIELPGGAEGTDPASLLKAAGKAASKVKVEAKTKTEISRRVETPKVTPKVARVRYERVQKADKHASTLAASRVIGLDEMQDAAILADEEIVETLDVLAWRNVGRVKETKSGLGKIVFTKGKDGIHRLHFLMKNQKAELKAHEKATQRIVKKTEVGVVTSESLKQLVKHKYRAEHEHESYYGKMKVDGNIFHIDSNFEDVAKTIRELDLEPEVKTLREAHCCTCCAPDYWFKCCIDCYNCCCGCFKLECFKCTCTICTTETEDLLYEWKANTVFNEHISQALQTYSAFTGSEAIDESGYQLEKFKDLEKPANVKIESLHKSLHSIYLVHRTTSTNEITLAQLVVAPDVPIAKIVHFVSTLMELTSPLPKMKDETSSASLWPRKNKFITLDGEPGGMMGSSGGGGGLLSMLPFGFGSAKAKAGNFMVGLLLKLAAASAVFFTFLTLLWMWSGDLDVEYTDDDGDQGPVTRNFSDMYSDGSYISITGILAMLFTIISFILSIITLICSLRSSGQVCCLPVTCIIFSLLFFLYAVPYEPMNCQNWNCPTEVRPGHGYGVITNILALVSHLVVLKLGCGRK